MQQVSGPRQTIPKEGALKPRAEPPVLPLRNGSHASLDLRLRHDSPPDGPPGVRTSRGCRRRRRRGWRSRGAWRA